MQDGQVYYTLSIAPAPLGPPQLWYSTIFPWNSNFLDDCFYNPSLSTKLKYCLCCYYREGLVGYNVKNQLRMITEFP